MKSFLITIFFNLFNLFIFILFKVKQHESFEYMFVNKLDNSKEEDRKKIENYWLNLEEGQMVDGLPVAYVETFK